MNRDLRWPVYLVAEGDLDATHVVLQGEEGRHAVSVRRHRVGETLVATDGHGQWVAGPVSRIEGRDNAVINVVTRGCEPAPQPTLTVAQALPKSDRADEAVELLTAVGADRLVAWQAARCVTKWSTDRAERGLRRWRRTVAEAAKQSRRVRWPEVVGPVDLAGILAQEAAHAEAVFVCHEQASVPLASLAVPRSGRIVLVVGPEGGLTDDEVAELSRAGGQVVSLGPTVLRTAAAGSVAATLVLGSAGRLG